MTPNETNETNEEPLITKMSIKGLGCKPTGGDPADDSKPNDLCVILGKATGSKMGEDANGKVFSALLGSFRGTNLHTGKSFRSGKLFLPSGIHEVVEQATGVIVGKEGASVAFAFRLSSVKASNPIGYSYQAVSLIPIKAEEDGLADLLQLVGTRQAAQIAAPEAKPEVKPEAPKMAKK